MKHRLPILLALLFAATAAAPLVIPARWRVWERLGRATTVPPPALPNRPAFQPPLLQNGGLTLAAAAPDNPPAQSLIERAAHEAERHRYTMATVKQEANLFGEHMIGSGLYRELREGPVPLIRLELQTEIAGRITSVTQVCDGQWLWTHRTLIEGESLTKIDARLAYDALLRAAQLPPKPGEASILPGLGGLARLLRGLASTFQFTTAERGHDSDLPVWRIRGGWRPELLAKLLPEQAGAILKGRPADLGRMPENMPDEVIVLLGQDDLFPYRIDFCRSYAKSGGEVGSETRALMTIGFSEVDFHTPIPANRFIYTPLQPAAEKTKEFLDALAPPK